MNGSRGAVRAATPWTPRPDTLEVVMHRAIVILGLAGTLPGTAVRAQVPPTPVRLVVDTLHGTAVPDPYRWLEDLDSEEVLAWFRAQGAYARAMLDALPGRAAVLERIRAIGVAAPPEVSLPREAGGRWFYAMRRPGEAAARGYVRDAWTGEERVLVDPATVADGERGPATLTTFLPSPDGRLVLYGVTSGGSENAVLRVRDVATGRDVDGPIERNRFDANAWSPDGRTFFYHQLRDLPPGVPPADSYRDIRILRHRLGEDVAADIPIFSAGALGRDDRLIPGMLVDARSGLAFGALLPNTGVERAWFVATVAGLVAGSPDWRPLFAPTDSIDFVALDGTDLYALARSGTPRIVRTRLQEPDLATADTVMVEGEKTIREASAALDGLYVRAFAEGVDRIVRIPWRGPAETLDLPAGTSAGQVQTNPLRSGIRLTLNTWISTPRPFRYDPSTGVLEELALRAPGPRDRLDGYVVETVFAPSHDGVLVPLTIRRPERLDGNGSLPVLLFGYGAYGLTRTPDYSPEQRVWYEAGGAVATCHVRGGGYYGKAWHEGGRKATKPNTWLDFIACAEFLIAEGYTRPERLAAADGSAGGITVGRAISERPDLFAAAFIQNGLLDAVRTETTPSGAIDTPEFGSVATEGGFRALLAMSPVHHVRPGTRYPAVLLTTGLNDTRVAPWESGKMAAALQAATTSGRPVLLRVDEAAGHDPGMWSDEQRRQHVADLYAFMMAQTGLPASRAPDSPGRR